MEQTFYFRQTSGALFGAYHAPAAGQARPGLVVLCQPHGHEYIRSHPAFRQVADHLARVGYPVLRFDFSACGDSAGACEKATLERWIVDVVAATDEGRARAGRERFHLIGARLGASVAFLASGRLSNVETLGLWDPVVRGSDYLAELSQVQAARLRTLEGQTPRLDGRVEYLGFEYPLRLLTDLRDLDLMTGGTPVARRILVLETEPAGAGKDLVRRLQSNGCRADHDTLPGPRIWSREEDVFLMAPSALLKRLETWLGGSGAAS